MATWSVFECNAFVTGLCFFLVFSGWSAVSNIATSTHGNVGSNSLSIVYLTLTISNLFTAKLINKYSSKYIMLFGSLAYCICIASNISDFPPLILYIASFLVGIGAAAIWVAQQMFITQCSNGYEIENNLEINSKLGYFNGLFYMIYGFKKIIGPAIGAISLTFGASVSLMYSILTLLCLIGSLGFLLLKPMHINELHNKKNSSSILHGIKNETEAVGLLQSETKEIAENIDAEHVDDMPVINIENNRLTRDISLIESVYQIFSLWKDERLWYLVPFTIYSGLDASLISGVFPLLIGGTKNKFYVVTYCGIVLCIASIIVGKLSDKIGRLSVLILSGICEMIVYSYMYMYGGNGNINIYHLVILGTLIGIGQSGYLTQISAIYPVVLKSRQVHVFANLKLFQSLSQAIAFYVQSIISIHTMASICCAVLICGLLPLIIIKQTREQLQTAKIK
eukprot:305230_1